MSKCNWTVFGAGENANKAVIATRNGLGGMHELGICQLKTPSDVPIGLRDFDYDKIEGIYPSLVFRQAREPCSVCRGSTGFTRQLEGERG